MLFNLSNAEIYGLAGFLGLVSLFFKRFLSVFSDLRVHE